MRDSVGFDKLFANPKSWLRSRTSCSIFQLEDVGNSFDLLFSSLESNLKIVALRWRRGQP